MSLCRTKRKHRLLGTILMLSSLLSGCASTMERAIGSAFETVIKTTADAVVETVVEVTVDAVVDATVTAAFACIDNDKPVLSGALPNPVLNQEYNGLVHVGIRNEPYDDSYDYTFNLYGDYPPGMRIENNDRQIRLIGTPTLPGVYNFNIKVRVEDGPYGANQTKGLCRTTDKESYQWTIQQV